jgi:RNA polymerase sigma-70 factor (ECF subfamily)
MAREGKKRCPDFATILAEAPPSAAVRDQIAECFHAELRVMAKRVCRSDTLAEDAAQSAFETGMEALGSFRGEGPIGAWFRAIVRSTCTRLKRTRRDDPTYHVPLPDLPESFDVDPNPLQDMQMLVAERLEILRAVLEDVPEPNRSLLLVHEVDGASLTDLAERFDLSAESVKARIKRTRQLVRERVLAAANEEV